jgi:hypothetical protein
MPTAKPDSYPPLVTEEQARHFLARWPALIGSQRGTDIDVLIDATVGLEKFPHLNVLPLYLACLSHPEPRVRMNSLSGLANVLQALPTVTHDQLAALYQVFLDDPQPLVRGAAVRALGTIAGTHPVPGLMPWLVGLVLDPSHPNNIRVNAYVSLIWREGRFDPADHRYNTFALDYDLPIERQVDQAWVEDLRQRHGSAMTLDLSR